MVRTLSGGCDGSASDTGAAGVVEPGCRDMPRTCNCALPPAGTMTEVVGTAYRAPAEATRVPKPAQVKAPPDSETTSKAISAGQ